MITNHSPSLTLVHKPSSSPNASPFQISLRFSFSLSSQPCLSWIPRCLIRIVTQPVSSLSPLIHVSAFQNDLSKTQIWLDHSPAANLSIAPHYPQEKVQMPAKEYKVLRSLAPNNPLVSLLTLPPVHRDPHHVYPS